MAEACIMRGLHTTLVEQNTEVMATLDPDIGHLASEALRTLRVELLLGERVESIEMSGGVAVGVTTDRRSIPADIVVLGIGVRPNASLADAAGIPLGETGAIWVDERQRTRVDHVWAAGDCAESVHLVSHRPIHIALGTVANKQGRICGINLGGGYARFPGVVGTATTKVGDTEISRTGLNESEARAAGFDYSSATISSKTRAGYFPGAEKITVKIVAERGTERLLGAQIVGGAGSAKRIDTLATAITAGMSATEFEYLDLSYAPPVSPVWEAAQIAARKAAQA
jgi:NADPH-dependent 2,4-dienoyl-CoA reductase/sulfur reductase-like enzyme